MVSRYAGMDINDLGSLITVDGSFAGLVKPTFRNMSNGITASRSRLFVNQARFENINSSYLGYDGLGIYLRNPNSFLLVAGSSNPSSTALDFSNCSQAIIYDNLGVNDLAQISGVRIDNTADPIGIGITAAGSTTEKIESGEWLIFNTAGKLLLSQKVSENEMQANINIEGLSDGIYFVSFVVNGAKRFNQKFIKIKSN
jgi:hypothetical protein